MSQKKDYAEGYFDDLIGHKIHAECRSWDEKYAIKTWGLDYQQKSAVGEIRQVRQHRSTGVPTFHIYFKDTNQIYTKLDLDYVLKYSEDIPLKYHELKAEYIVRKAREASAPQKAVLENEATVSEGETHTCSSKVVTNAVNNAAPKITKRGGFTPVVIGLKRKKDAAKSVEKATVNIPDDESKSEEVTVEELLVNSDVESVYDGETIDSEEENDDEDPGADPDADFIAWQRDTPPVQPDRPFLGVTGPRHTINAETATPYDYFCLFIPVFFWVRFAQYTNAKAEMVHDEQDGHMREWYKTCAAEIKAWVAAVVWWCLSKNQTFEQFYHNNIDPNLTKKWFPSWKRWTGIKRFFKIADPTRDKENKNNRMYKVQELFDFFIKACRANYWPNMCVAIDEAVKKFKGKIWVVYIKHKLAFLHQTHC
jgi:hypothetical protein